MKWLFEQAVPEEEHVEETTENRSEEDVACSSF